MNKWNTYKYHFFSIILCTVPNIKDDRSNSSFKPLIGNQKSDLATRNKVLSIKKAKDTKMIVTNDEFSG